MSHADQRRRVYELLERDDVAAAEEDADRIPHPWYRCQALASVAARTTDAARRTSILKRAFAAGAAADGPNRIVTVSSWCVRVLDDIGDHRGVAREVARLLALIDREPHPIRRMDAISMLRGSVSCEPTASTLDRRLMQALEAGHGWKRDALLRGLALRAARNGDRTRALSLLDRIEIPRTKRRTARDLTDLGMKPPAP